MVLQFNSILKLAPALYGDERFFVVAFSFIVALGSTVISTRSIILLIILVQNDAFFPFPLPFL
jgi:hypothetical protein